MKRTHYKITKAGRVYVRDADGDFIKVGHVWQESFLRRLAAAVIENAEASEEIEFANRLLDTQSERALRRVLRLRYAPALAIRAAL